MIKLNSNILVIAAVFFTGGVGIAQDVISEGKFTGATDHVTSGSAIIQKTGDGSYQVVLGDDFKLDGAPAPYVALGFDVYKEENTLGKLAKNKGTQSYAIPENIDPEKYNEIWIWCKKYNVPLGVAKLLRN